MLQVWKTLHFSNNQALCLREISSDGFGWALLRGPCSQTLTLKDLPSGQAGKWYWELGLLGWVLGGSWALGA